MTGSRSSSVFTAFWFYRATDARFELEMDDTDAIPRETNIIFEDHANTVQLRAAYSTIGLSAGADLMFWVNSPDLSELHALAADLHASAFSAFFELVRTYTGLVSTSAGEISLFESSPKSWVHVKTKVLKGSDYPNYNYYFAPRVIANHPAISTNVILASGLGDQDLVIVHETDHPADLIAFARDMNANSGFIGKPQTLGRRMALGEAISIAL